MILIKFFLVILGVAITPVMIDMFGYATFIRKNCVAFADTESGPAIIHLFNSVIVAVKAVIIGIFMWVAVAQFPLCAVMAFSLLVPNGIFLVTTLISWVLNHHSDFGYSARRWVYALATTPSMVTRFRTATAWLNSMNILGAGLLLIIGKIFVER